MLGKGAAFHLMVAVSATCSGVRKLTCLSDGAAAKTSATHRACTDSCFTSLQLAARCAACTMQVIMTRVSRGGITVE